MAPSFILWLHGRGDSGPNNEFLKEYFTSPQFRQTVWSFPSASSNPVTCNNGFIMPSWFDVIELPMKADSPHDETSLLKAVQDVHGLIDKEIDAGTDPKSIFICGFSQGGALTMASVSLYPKTLGGGVIVSGWVPFNSSIRERVTSAAKKTPIYWSHGKADRTVLFEAGLAGKSFLKEAGFNCKFKAYPFLGHQMNNDVFSDLESWIISHFTSPSRCGCFSWKSA